MTNLPTMSLSDAIAQARSLFPSTTVHSKHWQGVDISKKPEMAMHEILNYSFSSPLPTEDLDYYRKEVGPNLPWADRHFELERVSGEPINPGDTWKEWPYAHSASRFLDTKGQFNHSYAERYWPRYAGATPGGRLDGGESSMRQGIRYLYADLNDVVGQLQDDPLTRQAYMPVWFPEDGSHNDRKPCTLGYHFIMRDDKFHCVYYIRSCDFIRHFRDDIYLTIRLQLWILDVLRGMDPLWKNIKPGNLVMHVTSLHMFRNDYLTIQAEK